MRNRAFLKSHSSPLEFYLHRSQYIRLLLSSNPPNPVPAISYANATLRPFYSEHPEEFKRLMTCIIYLPEEKLRTSPYAELAEQSLHTDLEPLFAKEYCASLGMSRQVPLRVVGDIGGGGALARIEKGRKVMRERKSEWSQTDELPVSTLLLFWLFTMFIHIPSSDRNTSTSGKSISLDIRLPCLKGAVDRTELPNDDGLWTRHNKGKLAQTKQATRRRVSCLMITISCGPYPIIFLL
jgi:hypothetical protein